MILSSYILTFVVCDPQYSGSCPWPRISNISSLDIGIFIFWFIILLYIFFIVFLWRTGRTGFEASKWPMRWVPSRIDTKHSCMTGCEFLVSPTCQDLEYRLHTHNPLITCIIITHVHHKSKVLHPPYKHRVLKLYPWILGARATPWWVVARYSYS